MTAVDLPPAALDDLIAEQARITHGTLHASNSAKLRGMRTTSLAIVTRLHEGSPGVATDLVTTATYSGPVSYTGLMLALASIFYGETGLGDDDETTEPRPRPPLPTFEAFLTALNGITTDRHPAEWGAAFADLTQLLETYASDERGAIAFLLTIRHDTEQPGRMDVLVMGAVALALAALRALGAFDHHSPDDGPGRHSHPRHEH